MIYQQRGENKSFPESVEVWSIGNPIPEWLSDNAKVSFIDGNGNITLDVLENNTGGYQIKTSAGSKTLVNVKKRADLVCYGDNRVFSLSPKQFNLIYKSCERRTKKSIRRS